MMRRRADREPSPTSKRSRDRSSYTEHGRTVSPRRPRDERYSSSSYSRGSQRSSDGRRSGEHRCREETPNDFRTLYVRKFSSKLSFDTLQELLFREFEKFGDMSISVGHLDGERAALITFKYSEDAQEAYYAKPTVYLNDRSVPVEILPETIVEEDPRNVVTKNPRNTRRHGDQEDTVESAFDRPRSVAPKMDHKFVEMLAKTASVIPPGSTSLLGMPGITSSAMVAAAARALGLGAPPGSLAPPIPPMLPTISHNRHTPATGPRGLSPGSDPDEELKATRTLFVGSLESDITETEVLQAFERFGNIEQIDVKRAAKPGAHSYAFVRFEDVDMACRARALINGRRVRSFHCKIGFGKAIPSQCLHISGLGPWISTETFHQLLSRFGQVTQLDWPPDRRYARVMFETCESACNANSQLKGLLVGDRKGGRLRSDFINPEAMRFGRNKGPSSLQALLEGNTSSQSAYTSEFRGGGLPGQPLTDSTRTNIRITSFRPTDQQFKYTSLHGITDEQSSDSNWQPIHGGRQSGHRRHTFTRSTPRFQATDGTTDSAEKPPITLQDVVTLRDLDDCLQPDIWRGEILLKTNGFFFRCLHVIGDAEVGSQLGKSSNLKPNEDDVLHPTLRVQKRGSLDPTWMAEATHRIHDVLSNYHRGLCLLLMLPDHEQTASAHTGHACGIEKAVAKSPSSSAGRHFPLATLIAYMKLKQAVGVVVPVKPLNQYVGENGATTNEETNTNISSSPAEGNPPLSVHLFAPSSFALSLLKQAAPRLSSELATADSYMVLLAIRR
ncbi:hypothetical protein CRM22_003909 [Opisthorchis felineus]|uniref:RRM domain-containing protein n=1 Tax=Opisthorchis felineus TaxID=147828 RepID=A0A4S2M402_OPIFE|nr:hypothetical protein CRM22_003909 [Opisthorchis felineus]